MARLLILTRDIPYPPNAGDRIVTHGFMRVAAQGHDLHMLAYGDASDRHAPKHCRRRP